jgi:hypothetical protein
MTFVAASVFPAKAEVNRQSAQNFNCLLFCLIKNLLTNISLASVDEKSAPARATPTPADTVAATPQAEFFN